MADKTNRGRKIMARILLIDTDGVGLSIAWRCAQAGHEVRWFLANKPCISKQTGDGFKGVTKVGNWVSHVMWADLVLPTSNDMYVERMDFFRKKGARIFGPTVASANLEISRKAGMELLNKVGIETAPYETFKNMREAAKHAEKNPKDRYVFKTMGDNEDKSLTYVSKNAADLLEWMDRIIADKAEPKGEVMLQTFVKGIEMGVSRFMGSAGFVGPWNESFEHKKVMSGGFGQNCGEAGTVAAFTNDSKLGQETLAKCEEELLKLGHTGDVALGFMIDESGKAWPTEFTCRLGWPIENMMLGATEGDPVKWMMDALDGKDTTSFKQDIGCCIVATHGDFPHGNIPKEKLSDVPIQGITKGNKKYLHPQAVKINTVREMEGDSIINRPAWCTAGDYILVATGFGNSVKQACSRAYGTVKQLHVSNMGLRDDIGEELENQLPKLHKLGYATHFKYEVTK